MVLDIGTGTRVPDTIDKGGVEVSSKEQRKLHDSRKLTMDALRNADVPYTTTPDLDAVSIHHGQACEYTVRARCDGQRLGQCLTVATAEGLNGH